MESETKNMRWKFLGGFAGWFLVSTVVFWLSHAGDDLALWLIYLLVNVAAMVALAFREDTRLISLGIVGAMALNFFIALTLRPAYEAFCFMPVTYPRFSTRAVTTPVPANYLPKGFHDGSMGSVKQADCVAFGWALDPDSRDEDVKVRVLLDGEVVAQTVASAYRPDLNVPDGCPGGTCGFLIKLWGLVSHNEQFNIQVQAQDLQTDAWKNLSATPKTLNCGN